MKKRHVLNGGMAITLDNVCSVAEDNKSDIKENRDKLSKLDTKIWLIIIMLAPTFGTSTMGIIMGIVK